MAQEVPTAARPRVPWPAEPSFLLGADVDALLAAALAAEASDVRIKTGSPVVAQVHGEWRAMGSRPLGQAEAMEALSHLFRSDSGGAQLMAGKPLDFAYARGSGREARLRFRVHAGAFEFMGGTGVHIALRAVAAAPPTVEGLRVEPEILEVFARRKGMAVVSGPTGSGKTTLLASCALWMLASSATPLALATCESPIEYLLDDSDLWPSQVVQREVGRHVASFADGAQEALRQKLDAMLIGEIRDPIAASACMEAALTGHLAMGTAHATGAPETLRRLMGLFPEEQRSARAAEIVESLSLVVSQKLVPSTDGRRVALREFLAFDARVADDLLSRPSHEMVARARHLVATRGRTFLGSARILREEGLISHATYQAELDASRA